MVALEHRLLPRAASCQPFGDSEECARCLVSVSQEGFAEGAACVVHLVLGGSVPKLQANDLQKVTSSL